MTGRSIPASRIALGTALALLAACSGGSPQPDGAVTKDGRMPQSQVVRFGAGSTVAGERLYGRECAFCHVGRNTGTIMLGRRVDPAQAELHKRTDLDAGYVKTVVRKGLLNMPPLSKAEVTDQELDEIATWLAAQGKAK